MTFEEQSLADLAAKLKTEIQATLEGVVTNVELLKTVRNLQKRFASGEATDNDLAEYANLLPHDPERIAAHIDKFLAEHDWQPFHLNDLIDYLVADGTLPAATAYDRGIRRHIRDQHLARKPGWSPERGRHAQWVMDVKEREKMLRAKRELNDGHVMTMSGG